MNEWVNSKIEISEGEDNICWVSLTLHIVLCVIKGIKISILMQSFVYDQSSLNEIFLSFINYLFDKCVNGMI